MPKPIVRVAVVEDDPAVLKAMGRLINRNCFDPNVYHSAREFHKALPEVRPDCPIPDLQMPEMTALDLQHHLAEIEPATHPGGVWPVFQNLDTSPVLGELDLPAQCVTKTCASKPAHWPCPAPGQRQDP